MNAPPNRRPRIDPAAEAAASEFEAGPYGRRFKYSVGHAVLVRDFVDQAVALRGERDQGAEGQRVHGNDRRRGEPDATVRYRARGKRLIVNPDQATVMAPERFICR
jgi:hypothetical protein